MRPVRPGQLAIVMLTAAALIAPASAAAGRDHFKGRTEGGSKITFVKQGKRLKGMQTLIGVACFSMPGSDMRTGFEFFKPGKSLRLGRQVKIETRRYSALGSRKVGMTHTVSTRSRRRGKLIKGHLRLSYMWSDYDFFAQQVVFWNCTGSTDFSARKLSRRG